MATPRGFVEELRRQIQALEDGVAALSTSQKEAAAQLALLSELRAERLDAHASALLPDLTPEAVARLERQAPGVVDHAEVTAQVEMTRATFLANLRQLRARFEPARCAEQVLDLDQKLEGMTADYEALRKPVEALENDSNFKRLFDVGYGTSEYTPRWFDCLCFDLRYYRDWRDADEVVERAGAKDWGELAARYQEQRDAATLLREKVESLREQRRALDRDKCTHEEYTAALTNIEAVVLERLRTKLKGYLDSLDPLPPELSDLGRLSAEIARLQEQGARQLEMHCRILEQIAMLQGIRAKAERSRRAEIPEAYVEQLRAQRATPRGCDGAATPSSMLSADPGFGLMDALWVGQMASYFDSDSVTQSSDRVDTECHSSSELFDLCDRSGQS
jgi:DNA repair exonuclease SbcCD ATPase subunit